MRSTHALRAKQVTQLSRIEQRDRLIVELGILAHPIIELIETEADYAKKIPYLRAQWSRDFDQFINELKAFGRVEDISFDAEISHAGAAVRILGDPIGRIQYNTPRRLKTSLRSA